MLRENSSTLARQSADPIKPTRQTRQIRQDAPEAEQFLQPPPWLRALRDAMGDSIKGEDLKEIMVAQVKKAKEGDRGAANFVMNQAHRMLQSEAKRVTIIQNNYYDTPDPEEPVEAPAGSEDRVRAMAARARAGLPVTSDRDRDPRAVSDEEEKAIRRRQQQLEETEDTGPEGD